MDARNKAGALWMNIINQLHSLNKFINHGQHMARNTESVIKWNADFFNIGSAVGGVWQQITIFERQAFGFRGAEHARSLPE